MVYYRQVAPVRSTSSLKHEGSWLRQGMRAQTDAEAIILIHYEERGEEEIGWERREGDDILISWILVIIY